jgi:hypothetical protein
MNLSFKINNPNNIIIDTKENYYVIPFGHRCSTALIIKYASLRKFSLPFDWTIPLYPDKIKSILKNNFEDFIPDVKNNIFENKYGVILSHFDDDILNGIKQYERRIERFNRIIKENKMIYFVYMNEDYIYSKKYREKEVNDKFFFDMLELEKFLKKKYLNINYTILFFNFFEYKIPKDSNIINIVLKTDKVSDTICDYCFNNYRLYCAKLLSNVFKTKFEPYLNVKLMNDLFSE